MKKINYSVSRYYHIGFIALVFISLTAWSWRKWQDILVDFGHQLYVPWKLSEGELLYRDITYIMGPASQYFNALLFSFFGVSASTLIYANLILLILITSFIFTFFNKAGSKFSALIITLFFLVIFAFSQYVGVANYNYVTPYRHEMTHGTFLYLFMIFLFTAALERKKEYLIFFMIGLITGTAAVMKTEIFLTTAGISITGFLLLHLYFKDSLKSLAIKGSLFTLAAIIIPMFFIIFFYTRQPLHEAIKAVFTNWSITFSTDLLSKNLFYRNISGINQIQQNIALMMKTALSICGYLFLLIICDRSSLFFKKNERIFNTIFGVVVFIGTYFLIPQEHWFMVGRPVPLFCVILTPLFIVKAIRNRVNPSSFSNYFTLSLWGVTSVLMLLKMALYSRFEHYGFVLVMPGALLVIYVCIEKIPFLLNEKYLGGDTFRAGVIGVLCACMVTYFMISNDIYKTKNFPIGKGGDLFYADLKSDVRGPILTRLYDRLHNNMKEDETLLILPEGININYLLRKDNPLPFYLLTPWEMEDYGGEDMVLGNIKDNHPDFFVLLSIDMFEYGAGYFGDSGYGSFIMDWIKQNYIKTDEIKMEHEEEWPPFKAMIFKHCVGAYCNASQSN